MKKGTKKAVSKLPKKEVSFVASIKVLGKTFSSNGNTALEALVSLKPECGKGVSVLTVTKGEKSKVKILPAPQTFRLFSASRLMREVMLKNLSMVFDL